MTTLKSLLTEAYPRNTIGKQINKFLDKPTNPDELDAAKERDRKDYERQVDQGGKDEAITEIFEKCPYCGSHKIDKSGEKWDEGWDCLKCGRSWYPEKTEPKKESLTQDTEPQNDIEQATTPDIDKVWEKFYAAQERYATAGDMKSEQAAKHAMAFWHNRAVKTEQKIRTENRKRRLKAFETKINELETTHMSLYELLNTSEETLQELTAKFRKTRGKLTETKSKHTALVKEVIKHLRETQALLGKVKQSIYERKTKTLKEQEPYGADKSGRRDSPTITPAAQEGMFNRIKPGSRVTINNRFGQTSTGKAVMRGPAGWVLNMGGKHGTPGIATPENIVKVS